MKQGWQEITLGKICDILDFKRKPISKQSRIFGKYPYYGATGIVDYVNDYIFNEQLVLIGEDGAKWGKGENSSFIVSGKYWVNNHAHVIRPNRNTINDKYLVYFLNFTDLTKHITGATVQKLNQDKLKKISIFLPRLLSEQKRIVKILDKAFEDIEKIKENAKQNLQNSKDLFQSYLNKIFTENTEKLDKVALGKICKFVRGPFGGSLKKSNFVDKGYAVYEQQHAIYNQFDDLRYFISKEKFDEMKRFEVKSGDLIISCSGTMGKIAIVPQDIKKGIINQALLKLTVSNKIDNVFLKLWLESPIFQKTLSNYSKGVAIKNLVSVSILKEITINLPRLSIQKQIVKKLDMLQEKTKRLEEIYNKKLQLAEELKQSILHKAFNGEL